MSGMMIKVALYGLIRVVFEWLGATPRWLGVTLLTLGVLSALGGVLWALVQHDLKRLLAYSSIENVGIIVLGLGASLLFADAGEQLWAAHRVRGGAAAHRQPRDLQGAAVPRAPAPSSGPSARWTSTAWAACCAACPGPAPRFVIGAMAIAGLPPLNGFASEWLTLQSLAHLAFGGPLGVALAGAAGLAALAMTAALALLCFVKVVGLVLLGAPRSDAAAAAVEAPAADARGHRSLLAGLCVVLGLVPGCSWSHGSPPSPPVAIAWLSATTPGSCCPGPGTSRRSRSPLVLVALTAGLVALRGTRRAAPQPTWVCGQSWRACAELDIGRLHEAAAPRARVRAAPAPRARGRARPAGRVQAHPLRGPGPAPVETLLYEPTVRAGAAGGAR